MQCADVLWECDSICIYGNAGNFRETKRCIFLAQAVFTNK
jgi:hypothetical protein